MGKCEKCLEDKPVEFYEVYQPDTRETETHYLCSKCRNRIISNYFDRTKTGSW